MDKFANQEWQPVNRSTYRLPVPGGWLYKTIFQYKSGDNYNDQRAQMSMIFVSDEGVLERLAKV